MDKWIKYQVAVGRSSLTSTDWNGVCVADDPSVTPNEALMGIIRTSAPLPSPRFSGIVLLIAELLEKLKREKSLAHVEFPCLNVLSAANHPNLSSVEPGADKDLARLLQLLASQVAKKQLKIVKQAPFGRLNLEVGNASNRLGAIYNHSVVMYPSPEQNNEDAIEIRFFAPHDDRLRFERFLDFGQGELDAYIKRAVKLGDSKRLSVQRLARDDPNMFWLSVYRYRATFEALARASGDPEWNESLRDAVHTISYAAGSALDGEVKNGRKIDSFNFSKLQTLLTEENRMDHAESGFVQALSHCKKVAKVGPVSGRPMTVEMAEGMRDSRIGKFVQASSNSARNGGSAEEMERVIAELFPETSAETEAQSLGDKTTLVGQCRLCSGCGKKEVAAGIFKRCGRCRVDHVRYCGRDCQRKSWSAHKRVCSSDPNARPDPFARRAVIFPGDSDVKPYEVWIPGPLQKGEDSATIGEQQVGYICTELLGCESRSELIVRKAARGDPELSEKVLVLSRRRRDAPANMRASGAVTSTSEGTLLPSGDGDPNVKVRGDAVLIRAENCSRLTSIGDMEDFPLSAYKELYGIFMEIRVSGGSAVILLPENTSHEVLSSLMGEINQMSVGAPSLG